MMQTSQALGMQTLEMHLMQLFEQGLVSRETIIEKTGNADFFKERDKGI
jgi:Tfp pilus assembly ATPase PilU